MSGSNSNVNFVDTLDSAASVDRVLHRGIQHPVLNSAADVILTALDRNAFIDASGAPRTVTLPSAIGLAGMTFSIKKTAGANTVTVQTVLGQTIDGAASQVLSNINDSITIVSNGTNWDAISTVGSTTPSTVDPRDIFRYSMIHQVID